MSKSKQFALILIVIVSLVLTAFQPAPVTSQAPTPTKAPATGGAKTRFTSSINFEPPEALHGNPFAPPGVSSALRFVYDNLLDYVPAPTDTFHPMLGLSYKEEGTKLTVSLRKDAKWTDDKPFTSKDVICTYNNYFIVNNVVWRYLQKIEAPDDYTVVFNWYKASPVLAPMALNIEISGACHIYGKWSDQIAPLIAKRDANGVLSDADNTARNAIREDLFAFKPKVTEMIGTGPFRIANVTTSEMLLTKKDNAWSSKNVKFDEFVMMRYVTQEAYITNAVAGKYDGEQHGMPPDVFEQLKKAQPDMKVMWSRIGSQPGMEFNMLKAPVNSALVRKAIITAIDFKSVLPILEPGTFDPDSKISGLVPSFRDRWLSKEVQAKLTDYSYNPTKAAEYLKQAGWTKGSDGFYRDEKGQPVTLEIASMNSWPIFFMGGDAYTQQLNAFGIKTVFKPMELSAYWQYIDTGQHMIAMDFSGGIEYGQPYGAYRQIYLVNPIRKGLVDAKAAAGTKYEVKVKIATGETVDVLDLIDQLFYATDKKVATALVEKLAMAHNELVPFLGIGEKAEPIKIYAPAKKIVDFPGENEPYWANGLYSYARLMKLGKIAPK